MIDVLCEWEALRPGMSFFFFFFKHGMRVYECVSV